MVMTSYAHDSIRRRMDTAWQDAWDFGSFSFFTCFFCPVELAKASYFETSTTNRRTLPSLLGHSWYGMRNGSMTRGLARLAHEHVLILIFHLPPPNNKTLGADLGLL